MTTANKRVCIYVKNGRCAAPEMKVCTGAIGECTGEGDELYGCPIAVSKMVKTCIDCNYLNSDGDCALSGEFVNDDNVKDPDTCEHKRSWEKYRDNELQNLTSGGI
jgi:hypothetical protein